MSDCVLKHSKITIPWEGYPRVYYFSRRFLDLRKRFTRIKGALPNSLQDDELATSIEKLSKKFENNHVHIVMIGTEDISEADLYFGSPSSVVVECTKNMECPTLILYNTVIDDLDEIGQNNTISSICASKSTYLRPLENIDCLIVICRTQKQYSEKECTDYRVDLLRKLHTAIPDISYNIEIMLVPDLTDLKHQISSIYETHIVRSFSCIYRYLSSFTKPITNHCQTTVNTVPNETIQQNLKEYLNNPFSIFDVNYATFVPDLIERLAHVSKCSIVFPLSAKFYIQQWLCNRLLHEIQFEEGLVKSVSDETKHELEIFQTICTSLRHRIKTSVKQTLASRRKTILIARGLVVESLQKDFDTMIVKAQKVMSSMKTLTTVMNKMMFEIEGYLRQSLVQDVQCPQMSHRCNIPYMLRKEIMAIENVYGVGTIYGQLEIHLDVQTEGRVKEIMNLVNKLTRKYQFPYSFTLKNIEK